MAQVTIKQLLEAGVHFGHQRQRWNPKMKKYIFGERNGIYIINLEITVGCLQKALEFLSQVATEGKEILFVGTKKQAQSAIQEAAKSCEMPYVHQRWLGGTLTNFETIRKSISRLDEIDQMQEDGSFKFLKKKETVMILRDREKLLKNLEGIRKMKKLPGALLVIDTLREDIALKEAAKLGIPIVAVLDTNSDPDLVDYPIPGNDDAIRAIKLISDLAAHAIREGAAQKQQIIEETTELEGEKEVKSEEAPAAEEKPEADKVVAEEAAEATEEEVTEAPEEQLAAKYVKEDTEEETGRLKTKVKKPVRKEVGKKN